MSGFAGAVLALVAAAGGAELRFHDAPGDPRFGRVSVGLAPAAAAALARGERTPAEWRQILAVWTAGARPDLPPVLGRWTAGPSGLVFTPRFPFVAGMRYRARFDGAACAAATGAAAPLPDRGLAFTMPEPPGRDAERVVSVQPSGEVPRNLLRLYVHFSGPMRGGGVPENVRLLDGEGRAVPLAFVEVESGLWDPERRRLTLFLHPGRIKRGVAPREAQGPVLREGEEFRLVIGAGLRDATGRGLAGEHVHRLRVGPPDRSPPEPEAWRVVAPADRAGPVEVVFDEPLDPALLRRLVSVRDARGRRVGGEPAVSPDGTRWSLRPERPWTPGRYAVVVPAAVEDRAGNRVGRLFDAGAGDAAAAERDQRLEFEAGR